MRRLTEADRRAWEAYRRTADPLHEARRDGGEDRGIPSLDAADPAPVVHPPVARRQPWVTAFRVGEGRRTGASTYDLAPSPLDHLRTQPVAMDARAFHRLKAGKLRPEGKLDLHGMTLDVAHAALIDYLFTAHAAGKRLLLVVTGKGKRRDDSWPMPVRLGALRHQVPHWLRMPPLTPLVLQVTPAHRTHGGDGALYVYLKRAR